MEPVIELERADIPRAAVASAIPVIKKVTWSIQTGEFWALGAPPGTGKTDLLCTAAGLQRPTTGKHLLFGKDTGSMSEEELVSARLRIGLVFDSGRLFNGLTVAQNVALPLSYHRFCDQAETAAKVAEALQTTGLEDRMDQRPAQITRNLHQRIGLARALALKPEVLLIDNPLTGTDPREGRWWLNYLRDAAKQMTVIVATDDLRPWLDLATQFAVVRERHFDVIGGPEQVRASTDLTVRELLLPGIREY